MVLRSFNHEHSERCSFGCGWVGGGGGGCVCACASNVFVALGGGIASPNSNEMDTFGLLMFSTSLIMTGVCKL